MGTGKRPILLGIEGPLTPDRLRAESARAIAGGFDGIEWSPPHGPLRLLPGTFSALPEAMLRVRALAMRCETVDIDAAVGAVASQLRAAAALRTTVLNFSIPPLENDRGAEGFAGYQEAINFAHELLRRVRLDAEATGVAVAIEAPSDGCLFSPIELREIIDAANSSAVGACLDIDRILTIGSPGDWICVLHRRVHSVRYSDALRIGESGAAPALDVHSGSLRQALVGIPSDRPLILSASAAESGLHDQLRSATDATVAKQPSLGCR